MWLIGTSSFAVMKISPISASAAEDITNLMTWAIVNMGLFQRGTGSFLARKTCATARIQSLGLLWELAWACVASTILLAL